MYPGRSVDYRVKALAGLPTAWVTEITYVAAMNRSKMVFEVEVMIFSTPRTASAR